MILMRLLQKLAIRFCGRHRTILELQPMETCWAVVKNNVLRNCDFTMANSLIQLDDAFACVTSKTCLGLEKKNREVEDRFWEEDAVLYGQE